ncbi:MAG: FtsK/SpoIIIE domain-containing protein [Candidatus Taylorbacteria bacterium]|nr:FtsK/SpoIIIE domain-containing protein [Candidatus Taylorbacteria bacterium]
MKTNLDIKIATDEYGKDVVIDLSRINHLLVAGNIGSGKSAILHNIVSTLISNNFPGHLKLVLIDIKKVEFGMYNMIPHLLTPVISDQKKAILAMKWGAKEMSRRFDILARSSARNIEDYHKNILKPALIEESKKPKPDHDSDSYYQSESLPESMPYIFIVIDEISDFMSMYPKETETAIVQIIEKGHIVGIQMLISTSRPNTKIFTKPMKDLIGTRIALQITSPQDSKSVIGTGDACNLKEVGHMLYREGMKYIMRGQSTSISIDEIKKVVKNQVDTYKKEVMSEVDLSDKASSKDTVFSADFDSDQSNESDELYEQAKEVVIKSGKASTSWLQRKLGIGYSRSAHLIDLLEQHGVVGSANGSKSREVYSENKK